MLFWIDYNSRKYCKAIMNDILLFTPTYKSHIANLEDLLKVLLKKWIKDITKEMPAL